MAKAFEYYEAYNMLKIHFKQKSYIYGTGIKGINERWKTDQKRLKPELIYFKDKYTLKEFKYYLTSNLIINPNIYFKKLKSDYCEKNYKKWKKYNNNSLYNFEKDLQYIYKKINSDVIDENKLLKYLEEGKINFDTVMYIDQLLGLRTVKPSDKDLWKKYGLLLEKYRMVFNNIPIDGITEIYKKYFIIKGE